MSRERLNGALERLVASVLDQQARWNEDLRRLTQPSLQAAKALDSLRQQALGSLKELTDPWGGLREQVSHMRDQQTRFAEELKKLVSPGLLPDLAQKALESFGAVGLRAESLRALQELSASSFEVPLVHAADRLKASIDSHLSMFAAMGPTLARALEVPAFLRDLRLPTPAEQDANHQRLVRDAESLARAGWTVPWDMSVLQIVELAEQDEGIEPAALDEWFVAYYAAHEEEEFRALTSRLLRRKRLRIWRTLLWQCVKSYKRGWYELIIPALLAVIEGLVCEVTGTLRRRTVDVPQNWRRRAPRPPKGLTIEVDWCVTAAFLEMLWSFSAFDGPPPDGLNRHRVLHGRRPQVGGQADALRLLAAVDFIAEAAHGLDRLTKKLETKQGDLPEDASTETSA